MLIFNLKQVNLNRNHFSSYSNLFSIHLVSEIIFIANYSKTRFINSGSQVIPNKIPIMRWFLTLMRASLLNEIFIKNSLLFQKIISKIIVLSFTTLLSHYSNNRILPCRFFIYICLMNFRVI